jgi:hypothetical protein
MTFQTNVISAELTDEALNNSIASIKQVESNVSFALTYPVDDRITLPRIGPKIVEFTEKAYEYMDKNPQLKPDFIDGVEFGKDVKLTRQVQILRNHLVPLVEKLNNTHSISAAEAYMAARLFYHHVKNAAKANIPGASAIAEELGKLFDRRPSVAAAQKAKAKEKAAGEASAV